MGCLCYSMLKWSFLPSRTKMALKWRILVFCSVWAFFFTSIFLYANQRFGLFDEKHPEVGVELSADVKSQHFPRFPEDSFGHLKESAQRENGGIQSDGSSVYFTPKSACVGKKYMIIMVCSAYDHFELRHAIRATWGSVVKKTHFHLDLVFVLGLPEERHYHLGAYLKEEQEKYGDILQVNVTENYTELTEKSLAAMKWMMDNCQQTSLYMKTDDDVYIHVPNLFKTTLMLLNDHRLDGRFMLGYNIKGAKPIQDRKNKWYMPSTVYKNQTYPPYLSGAAYVMKTSLAKAVYEESQKTKHFWLEDIFITGILGQKLNAILVHNKSFIYQKSKIDLCDYKKAICIHELSPVDIYEVWKNIHVKSTECS